MAIYELDGQKPEFPPDGLYWVAETASVIGRAGHCRAQSLALSSAVLSSRATAPFVTSSADSSARSTPGRYQRPMARLS